ncbi:hypothetical protein T492DRAFT_904640 [Pavlovales sp. CCMP2436]|nr:hypothetical protein T492DRAFT_904640 [Pavlovales sp. CCMP2436]
MGPSLSARLAPAASSRQLPRADLRFGCTGRLDLLLRLGLARARLRSLKIEAGKMEMGLLRFIAGRCDLSALERLEYRTPGGYVHSYAQQNPATAAVDFSGAVPENEMDYGLGLVLAKLSAAEHGSMRVLWDSQASPLAELLRRSPLLGLLDCNLDAAADLCALALLPNLRCLILRLRDLGRTLGFCEPNRGAPRRCVASLRLLDSFHRDPALQPAPRTRERSFDRAPALRPAPCTCKRRLQRFVFGFLIIHHFYQLPTSA